ncbi:MAG: C-terminal target protein [Flavipsychrobacter sp.]|nr:C-terminal target protein [Flavipsychrobacter sp.]
MKKLFTLFSALTLSAAAFAQIPNAGFETWTNTSGYDVPAGWDQLNAVTTSTATYTCAKGTPGDVGSSYLKLESKTVTGMGVMPGVAVSGVMDMTTYQPKSGFPYTARPMYLTGSWQYMAFGSDQGHIAVLLSKWNITLSKRDTISFTHYSLPFMIMSWAPFSIPLAYQSGATPDSAVIVLSASGTTPENMSYLYIDNLSFTGTVPAGVINIGNASASMVIFPNPAINEVTVKYMAKAPGKMNVSIADISGKVIISKDINAVMGDNALSINTSTLSKGLYIVHISDGLETQVGKVVIE